MKYSSDFASLVTPKADKLKPIYSWHTFKHGFSSALPRLLAEEFQLKKGSWIVDPFCGSGTTLLASKQLGFNAHGVDVLPFSVFLSNGKVANYDIEALRRSYVSLKRRLANLRGRDSSIRKERDVFPMDVLIIKKAFPKAILDELLFLKHVIAAMDDVASRNFFSIALLSILERSSRTSKDGGFLRLVERKLDVAQIQAAFFERCETMLEHVASAPAIEVETETQAFLGDARSLAFLEREYDCAITSPPYPNRHDYTRIYLLELCFGFVASDKEVKGIRYDTLRSHVEAKKRYAIEGYQHPRKLKQALRAIEEAGTNNSKVSEMLDGYFEDMHRVLQEMHARLRTGAMAAMVVSNAQFSGVPVEVDRSIESIARRVGFNPKGIKVARTRGNSPQQMGVHSRLPSRESIVILQRA